MFGPLLAVRLHTIQVDGMFVGSVYEGKEYRVSKDIALNPSSILEPYLKIRLQSSTTG